MVAESGYHMEAKLNGSAISLTKDGTTYTGTASMPSRNATIVMTKVADAPQPTPTERSLTVNGTAKEIGSTVNCPKNQTTSVVINLPAGDPWIGKSVGYADTMSAVQAMVNNLVAGENTLSLQSFYWEDLSIIELKVGTISANQWVGNPDALVTLVGTD